MSKRSTSFICFVAMMLVSSMLTAQPTSNDIESAQKLNDEALSNYKNGEYQTAIEGWRAAAMLADDPLFHYNISSAWLKLGKFSEAYDAASRGHETTPESDARLKARLAGLDARLFAIDRSLASVVVVEKKDDASLTLDPVEPSPRFFTASRVVAVISAGIGIAALGTAGYFQIAAANTRQDIEAAQAAGKRELFESERSSYESTRTAGRVALGVAAVTTALSASLFFIKF